MATDDHERYCRLTLLTHKGGKFVGEHILVREIDRLNGSPTLVAFLSTKKRHLKDKKYRHEITTNQFDMLYPRDGSDTNVKDLDLQLLLKIILEFFTSTLNSQGESDLREILRIRNAVCHMSEPKLCELEFEASMDALVGCIYRLTKRFDESMAVKAIKIIGDFRSGPLSPKQIKEMVAQVGIHDEQMKDVVDVLARLGVKQEDNSTVINELLERVKKIESSVTSSETHRIHVPNVQTQLTISGDREETVTKANDLVLHNLNVAIDNDEDPNDKEKMKCVMTNTTENSARQYVMVSPTDDRVIKRTVREMVQEIESKNSKVVSAQRGSILINIQCNTLSGLKELLMWLKEKGYRSCLHNLERALEIYFISKFDADLTLSEGSILELSNWAGLCLSNLVNAQTDTVELPCKSKVNMTVKCSSTEAVSKVVAYFTYGAANRLNTLSETLSKAVGGRIRVNATLDMAKLLTDLEKAETDQSILETSSQLTTQTTTDEPEYTDIKTRDDEKTSSTDHAFPTLEQDISNISLGVNEKAETDPSMLETSPQLTTQPGYTDIKKSDGEKTSSTDQAFLTFKQDVSYLSLDVNDPGAHFIRSRYPNKTRFHLDAELASAMFQKFLDKRQEAAVYIPSYLQQFVAIADFRAVEDVEMCLQKGDVVEILRTGPNGWWLAHHLTTNVEGWLPSTYLDPVPNTGSRSMASVSSIDPRVSFIRGFEGKKVKSQKHLEKRRMDLEKPHMDLEKRRMDLEKPHMDLEKRRMDLEKPHMDREKRRKDLEKPHTDLKKLKMDLEKRRRDYEKTLMDYDKPQMDLKKRGVDHEKMQKDLVKMQMDREKTQMDYEKPPPQKDLVEKKMGLVKMLMDRGKSLKDRGKSLMDLKKRGMEHDKMQKDPVKRQKDLMKMEKDEVKRRFKMIEMQMDREKTLMDREMSLMDLKKRGMDHEKMQKDPEKGQMEMVKMQMDREKTLTDREKSRMDLKKRGMDHEKMQKDLVKMQKDLL